MKKLTIEMGLKGAAAVASGRSVAVDRDVMANAAPRKKRSTSGKRGFEGAKLSGPQALWMGTQGDANYDIQAGLEKLRARSRDADQNEAYAHDIIEKYIDLLVSTGIKPTPDTGNDTLNETLWKLWNRWGQQPVAGSQIDIYGFERLMCRHLVMDGEAVARFRYRRPDDMPGLPAFKIQMLEADLLPVTKTERMTNGNKVISAVEFDQLGEIVAYYLLKDHPGASMFLSPYVSNFDASRVPSENILHAFYPTRSGQVRGIPWLTPILMTLKDFHDMQYSVLVAIHAISTLAFVVTGGDSSDPVIGLNPEIENGNVVTDADGLVVEEMSNGLIAYAPDGKTVERTTPQMPTGVKDIVSMYLHEVSAAIGLSYHTVSGDMSDASFAQAKLGLIHESVHLAAIRELVLIPMILRPLWNRFVKECQIARLIPDVPTAYDVRWTTPKIPRADEQQEVKTAILKMQAGLDARPHLIEEAGLDPDTVTKAIAADRELTDELDLVFLGDLKQVTLSGQMQAEQTSMDSQDSPDATDDSDNDDKTASN